MNRNPAFSLRLKFCGFEEEIFSFVRDTIIIFPIRFNDDYTVCVGTQKFCLQQIDFHGADGAGGDAKFTAVAFFGIK